jgi:hypothetical protein
LVVATGGVALAGGLNWLDKLSLPPHDAKVPAASSPAAAVVIDRPPGRLEFGDMDRLQSRQIDSIVAECGCVVEQDALGHHSGSAHPGHVLVTVQDQQPWMHQTFTCSGR